MSIFPYISSTNGPTRITCPIHTHTCGMLIVVSPVDNRCHESGATHTRTHSDSSHLTVLYILCITPPDYSVYQQLRVCVLSLHDVFVHCCILVWHTRIHEITPTLLYICRHCSRHPRLCAITLHVRTASCWVCPICHPDYTKWVPVTDAHLASHYVFVALLLRVYFGKCLFSFGKRVL